MRCRVCRGHGFVELRAVAVREEDVARVPEEERSVRRAEASFIVRAPCDCAAGERWYSVRVSGVEVDRAPRRWVDAIVAAVAGNRTRGYRLKTTGSIARAMQLPEPFVRAILAKARADKREAQHAEEDQESR